MPVISGRIAMPRPEADDLVLWYALNRLMTNYWADVDNNAGDRAHEFYLPDELYAVGNNRFEGIEKIRAFYQRRRRLGNATTRHLVGNIRIFPEDQRNVRAVGIMSLYRSDGRPPDSRCQAAGNDRRFRGAVRAGRRSILALPIPPRAADFCQQRPPRLGLDRPPPPLTPVTATRPARALLGQ